MNLAVATVARNRRKHTSLPFLIVLFVVSYALLVTMLVQQSKTINSQRSLIHLLFKDNMHLSALRKGQVPYGGGHAAEGNMQNSVQTPSTKIPVIQVPPETVPAQSAESKNAQSKSSKDQGGAKTDRKSRKAQKPPARPPAEMTDPSDMRRVSFST